MKQADAHAVALGRMERIEQPVGLTWREAFSRLPNAQAHMTLAFLRPGHQIARTVVDFAHRFRGVRDQAQDHLLKL